MQVTDSGGLLDTQVVSIGVNDINESPTSISLTGGSVNENSTTGTTVGTASGTDVDAADTLSYSLINTASGRFQVDSVTGIITVADGTQLNFESASSHNITVRATDTGGLSYDESFTITISDVNEAPTAAADSFTGRQLKALIVPAGLVTANDFDIDGDSISVVVVNAPTSGTIQLNSDGSFSYTPKNSFSGLDSFT